MTQQVWCGGFWEEDGWVAEWLWGRRRRVPKHHDGGKQGGRERGATGCSGMFWDPEPWGQTETHSQKCHNEWNTHCHTHSSSFSNISIFIALCQKNVWLTIDVQLWCRISQFVSLAPLDEVILCELSWVICICSPRLVIMVISYCSPHLLYCAMIGPGMLWLSLRNQQTTLANILPYWPAHTRKKFGVI